jgi:hypothetical protein
MKEHPVGMESSKDMTMSVLKDNSVVHAKIEDDLVISDVVLGGQQIDIFNKTDTFTVSVNLNMYI